MVKFTSLPLSDPRLQPQTTKTFLKIGQLLAWELVRGTRTFTGLLIVGEKTISSGLQTAAECTLDIPTPQIPLKTSREIIQTVAREFGQRPVMLVYRPAQAPSPALGKIQGNLKVGAPTCGHRSGINATQNPATGEFTGACALCGAPAKVEMEITTPSDVN